MATARPFAARRRASAAPRHGAARRLGRILALALLATGLAACVGDLMASAPPAASARPAAAAPKPVARAAALAAPTAPAAYRPAAPRAPRHAGELVGLDEATLVLLLGQPRLKRREPPAEVWQYAGKACTLHLFLYRGAGEGYRVLHVEAGRGRAGGDCLERLLEERRPRPRES